MRRAPQWGGWAIVLGFAWGLAPQQARSAPSFRALGDGAAGSPSRNGQFVLFQRSNGDVYRWSAATGQIRLGLNVGSGFASAVSNDGNVVTGLMNSSGISTAFRWTPAGVVSLGDLPGGGFFSYGTDMSADGSVIVGYSKSTASANDFEGFRWTAGTGMLGLGDLSGGTFRSSVNGVSADGSVVVGTSQSTSGTEAFRWTEPGGMVGLGDLPGGVFNSQAFAVSGDGNVVAGHTFITPSPGGNPFGDEEVFRWTAQTGIVGLNKPPGVHQAFAYGVSGDGSVIVGHIHVPSPTISEAIIWDAAHGIRWLQDVLTNDYGLNLGRWSLQSGSFVSEDGLTITGYGIDPSGNSFQGWMASIPEPAAGMLVISMLGLLARRRRR